MRGLSLVAVSGGYSSSQCAGLSLLRPLALRSTGSRRTGSVVVAHGPSCSTECGIFLDQGSNPCPLHRQADSQPLRQQGSPKVIFLIFLLFTYSFWREMDEETCSFGFSVSPGSSPLCIFLTRVQICIHNPSSPHSCSPWSESGDAIYLSKINLVIRGAEMGGRCRRWGSVLYYLGLY